MRTRLRNGSEVAGVCDNHRQGRSQTVDSRHGEMSEWLKEHAWKACVGETLPRVRIPLSPPTNLFYRHEFAVSVDPVATMLPRGEGTPGESSSRIALSAAAGVRCMYRCVVVRSACPANS